MQSTPPGVPPSFAAPAANLTDRGRHFTRNAPVSVCRWGGRKISRALLLAPRIGACVGRRGQTGDEYGWRLRGRVARRGRGAGRQSSRTARSSLRRRAGSAIASISTIFPPLIVKPSTIRSRPRGATTTPTAPLTSAGRAEEHTSELQSLTNLVCRLL